MKKLLVFGLVLGAFVACKDNQQAQDEFNKTPIMENLADNYIIPHYTELKTRVNALNDVWNTFLADQSNANFTSLQNAYLLVSEEYHRVKALDFGPAMDAGLTMTYGIFPTDTTQIISNLSNWSCDLTLAENTDAQGLDALDYLLFKSSALIQLQSSGSTRQYVSAIITLMKDKITTVCGAWTSYRSTFVAGTGTSITSPFSLVINTLCKDFEVTKNAQLGIPIGKQTLGNIQPLYFQAKWSRHNTTLLAISIEANYAIYKGLGNAGDGTGLDDYLNAINRQDIASSLATRFDYLNAEIATWSEDLKTRLESNPTSLNDYYEYMQGTVVYLKTDMPSAFGVVISYQDNDGD